MTRGAPKPSMDIALPRVSAAARSRAADLLAALRAHYPDAHCELDYTSPHELLVATILSAQATDVSVNKATPALFQRFPTPAAFARSTPADIEPYIRTIGLFRTKARAIHAAMTEVASRFLGEVPRTMADLLTLRGVARKTANVVLGNAFNINVGFVVDTHIARLSVRLGLVPRGMNVASTERLLMALFPQDSWCLASHLLIWHGRRACKARLSGGCAGCPSALGAAAPPPSPSAVICQRFGAHCELRVSARPSRKPATRARPTPRG
ncbi:MAG: endonuclease III [Phycisphaerales bacterium]